VGRRDSPLSCLDSVLSPQSRATPSAVLARSSVTRHGWGSSTLPLQDGPPVGGSLPGPGASHSPVRPPRPAPAGARGGGSGWSSRSAVGTGPLRRSPAVHAQPIDLVVFQEPSQPSGCRKPGFEAGFALRCLQRLSDPDLATRRCPERDSRHTSGRSSPILSY
jgi:hypothetical protein